MDPLPGDLASSFEVCPSIARLTISHQQTIAHGAYNKHICLHCGLGGLMATLEDHRCIFQEPSVAFPLTEESCRIVDSPKQNLSDITCEV
jgi:hypothetical protein